jgi:cation:H+ antiporter
MFISIVFVLVGLGLLVKGADSFVESSAEIASRLGISQALIGLTLVAFGTSLPEWIVSLLAAYRGSTDLALGNVVGSNIANIAMVLGAVGIVCGRIRVSRHFIKRDYPLMFVLAIMAWLFSMGVHGEFILTRAEGFAMFSLFFVFAVYAYLRPIETPDPEGEGEESDYHDASVHKLVGITLVGFICLSAGSELLVRGAQKLALGLGVSESTVGITMVAFGTSLPELAASIAAGLKNRLDMLVGGIIGSNIANTAVVLGSVSMLVPISVAEPLTTYELPVMVLISALLWWFIIKGSIERWQGVFLFVGYSAFIVSLFTFV